MCGAATDLSLRCLTSTIAETESELAGILIGDHLLLLSEIAALLYAAVKCISAQLCSFIACIKVSSLLSFVLPPPL